MKKNFIFGFICGLLLTLPILSFFAHKPKKKEQEEDEWGELKRRINVDAHLLNIGQVTLYHIILRYKPYPGSKYRTTIRGVYSDSDIVEKVEIAIPSSQKNKRRCRLFMHPY